MITLDSTSFGPKFKYFQCADETFTGQMRNVFNSIETDERGRFEILKRSMSTLLLRHQAIRYFASNH